ncbi:NAD-dependent epimerase/dehydratase family protein [Pseudomonas fluorescens]|jgi:nucleoside-diphosphate-sugar epimerase|uniref:UDP-glucose 4-epimerase family protein n=1 Tax=Pseudomonas atacamensis TaxID=2565368 RepID=UPI000F050B43|nr:NAD-dependent epimerase/dehydratase family protein [Pseudomonas fluorescens]
MTAPKVLVTGASGFIGEALIFRLLMDKRFTPIAASRKSTRLLGLCRVVPFDLNAPRSIPSLADFSVIIHCAARVHVMDESAVNALSEFRKVNVDGTLRLATQAAECGVKRFIFISSVKVNGERTFPGKPFAASDTPAPVDPYGVSKCEAEEGLRRLSSMNNMEIVIVRPPLVYGPGVKANFERMLSWLSKGLPLPLGAIHNKRSLVAVDNLVDLLVTCIDHPAAANQTFMVSDGEDLSTTQMLRRLSTALGKTSLLMPLPRRLLILVGRLIGKKASAQRLCESLQVDIGDTCARLSWHPPVTVEKAMRATVVHFQGYQSK